MKNQTYRMTMLFDFYGELLTDRQKEFFDLYYNEDLSLSEIAENEGISRQGVRDVIVRAEAAMQEIEDKTGAAAKILRDGGLVGIVTRVGKDWASVRSIIDDSSRVSAMAQQSGDSCIVAGDLQLFKEGRLKLSYMEKDDDIKDGDMIVTSNISGKFLPGILVGYATDITVDYNDNLTKSGYLIPAARFDRLQEVLVITDLKDAGPEINE